MMKAAVRSSCFVVAVHGQGPGYVTYEPPPHALIDGVAEVCLLLHMGTPSQPQQQRSMTQV